MAQHIQIPGTLTFDLTAPFTQQGILNAIRSAYPTSPDYTVVSLAVPLVHINCLETGVIDPVGMLKDAALKLYNYFMQYYIQPIWNALYSLYEALKSFGLGLLDITIPVLDLTLPDLFDPDLINKIKAKVLNWWNNLDLRQNLIDLLNLLGIPWPLGTSGHLSVPQFDIEYIVNAILNSLWSFVLKLIKKVISLISQGLRLWELATQEGAIVWSQIWDNLKDAVLGYILDFLTNVPTIQEMYDALIAWAKSVYNKAVVTAEEILAIIKDFKFFGLKPFDWDLPWNPKLNMPEVDLMRMLNSMLVWFKNFLFSIIKQFIDAVMDILSYFGVSLASLLTINIPVTYCAVRNET